MVSLGLALNPMGFKGEVLNPILNYVEFRTNHAPYVVHGVVQEV
jgi:hypothetical protein